MPDRKKRRFVPEILYLGTTEEIGKTLSHSNIEPPVVLSDVYSPFFAQEACKQKSYKWCIVEINCSSLNENEFHPFHGYLERWSRNRSGVKDPEGIARRRKDYLDNINLSRIKWHQSFDICGTVLYTLPIKPENINKITTFNPKIINPNKLIVSKINSCVGPWETTGAHHRQMWEMNKKITDWMACDLCSNQEDWMLNREGLELYYKISEKKK